MRSGPLPNDVGCDAIVAKQQGPYPDPTLPAPPTVTIPGGGDAAAAHAIERGLEEITALRSYRFSLDVLGRDLTTLQPSGFDFAVRATVDRSNGFALDGVLGSAIVETNGTGASVSGSQSIKAGHGYLWGTDNVSEVLEPSNDPRAVATIDLLTPDGAGGRFLAPFAAGYRSVGPERHDGIASEHYRVSTKGIAAYASTLAFKGKLTADIWIAAQGGHLLGARVRGTGSHVDPTSGLTIDEGFTFAFELTHVNDPANVVTLPATPLPDPVRPTVQPVDLMLTYRVLPAVGRAPTSEDLDAIGVALRTRLDVSKRPIKVDTKGVDTVVVTVCGTTNPDADRRLITSHGALNVVPLPRNQYGTSNSPGLAMLPAVGSQIDPSLEPIAPPKGAGLTTAHVDPDTGGRGLALLLGNQASDAFRTYASGHRGEFVAVVLDGTVLATMPIDDRTARAHFVFTGDYTEAETRLMASYLYRDPILSDLRPIEDVEIPAQR
jgi:hypothetical protein